MSAYGIQGDPAGMRQLAAFLRREADRTGGVSSDLTRSLVSIPFLGPAGERFRSRRHASDKRLRGEANRLQDFAARLLRAAYDVELEQQRAKARQEARR